MGAFTHYSKSKAKNEQGQANISIIFKKSPNINDCIPPLGSWFFLSVNQQPACSPDVSWLLREQCWLMAGRGRWEGACMMTCRSPSSAFVPFPPPWPNPAPVLPQSPTGSGRCLVMKGLSNGSFLYPRSPNLVRQLSRLHRAAFILSMSGSECMLNGWILLSAQECVCMCVFSLIDMD